MRLIRIGGAIVWIAIGAHVLINGANSGTLLTEWAIAFLLFAIIVFCSVVLMQRIHRYAFRICPGCLGDRAPPLFPALSSDADPIDRDQHDRLPRAA